MSGVATRLAVGYVRERAGEQAVAALLARAGERRTVAQLEQERGWSSYAQWLALLEAAVAVLGDGDAPRRIGAPVVSQRVGGASRVVVRALGSVEAVYRHARGAAAKFSTMKTVEPLEVSRQHARIAVRLADGHPPHPLDCDFSAGSSARSRPCSAWPRPPCSRPSSRRSSRPWPTWSPPATWARCSTPWPPAAPPPSTPSGCCWSSGSRRAPTRWSTPTGSRPPTPPCTRPSGAAAWPPTATPPSSMSRRPSSSAWRPTCTWP